MCCEECGTQYPLKTRIDELRNREILNPHTPSSHWLTRKEYFQKLDEKAGMLEKAHQHACQYYRLFQGLVATQESKYRQYYNQILEVIEAARDQTEGLFEGQVNSGFLLFDHQIKSL